MESQLSSHHQKTYERLVQHPMPHNLQWRDVWSMLGALPGATAVEDDKGNLKCTRNGQSLVLHPSRDKDMTDNAELMKVRHFLDGSHSAQQAAPAAPAVEETGTHLLVVIDHREARIFNTQLHGATPQRITPYDPHGFGRTLHYNQDDASGQRKPVDKSFYEAVAKTLQGAQQILMFGTGSGGGSAMAELLQDLKKHHPDLAARVIGPIAVDEHHLSEAQLLAKARELFTAH